MPPTNEQQNIAKTITFRERYFSFSGRIGRKAYFLRFIYLLLLMFAYLWVPVLFIRFFGVNAWGRSVLLLVSVGIFLLIKDFIFLCIDWRRFQDLNMPGPLAIINIAIPAMAVRFDAISRNISYGLILINLAIFGYLLLKKGTVGANKYGPDPLDETIVGNNYTEKLIFWPAFLLTCTLLTYMKVTKGFPFLH